MMFESGFPGRLEQEVQFVSRKIMRETYRNVSAEQSSQNCSWILPDGETVTFPYRVYDLDYTELMQEEFTPAQQIIYHCIFSRCCDGFVREKHIRALLESAAPIWAMPYIIKACDEYVVEILELVYENLKEIDTSDYKQICQDNLPLFLYGHNRMISYWNEFYRDRCSKYSLYVGRKLYKECFGYVRSMEKRYVMNIDEQIDKKFRGIVLIVQNNKIICERQSGFADLPNEVPNTLETRFASASAGKVFVAVGILQLIDHGKLKFEDTLGDLLDLDFHAIDPEVTVEQLLTHTSGVPDYFDESTMDDYEELWRDYPNYKIRCSADLLPLFINKPMMYPRGAKFQYNNSGYVLLALIMERVTGVSFDRYLQKHVFDVCGMKATGYYELDRLPAKCANHYIYCADTEDYRTNIFSVDAKGTGAGGAFINVNDMIRFWNGLCSGELLSRRLTSAMVSSQSGKGADCEEGNYGYGVWIIDNSPNEAITYVQGSDPGVSFLSEYNPEKNIISVLVSNYGDNVWREMRKIRLLLY